MIKNVAVIGTGVIGAGWIIRCLAHNKKVVAFDKDLKLKKRLIAEIKLSGLAKFLPAMSNAVPGSGEVLTKSKPNVTLTPL